MEDLGVDLYEKLARAIVAFEMPIERIEGKFKLGQNRSRDELAEFIRKTLVGGSV